MRKNLPKKLQDKIAKVEKASVERGLEIERHVSTEGEKKAKRPKGRGAILDS